jgi:hypothetical protein
MYCWKALSETGRGQACENVRFTTCYENLLFADDLTSHHILSVSAYRLLSQGYTMLDIVKCTMKVLDLKQKRSESVRNRKWDGFHSFMEVTKRRLKKTGSLGYTSMTPARPRAPAAPVSSPRTTARRGSLFGNTPNLDLGSKVLQRDSGGALLRKKQGGSRRRFSLDLGHSSPNADWALTA